MKHHIWHAIWTRVLPVLALATVIGVVYVLIGFLPIAPGGQYDRELALLLSCAFALWVIAMLARTRRWDWFALAILAAFFGDTLIYSWFGQVYPPEWNEDVRLLLRATFTVTAFMLIAQAVYDTVMWIRNMPRTLRGAERNAAQDARDVTQQAREDRFDEREARAHDL